jgi:MoaA/NifB/PqqE/SkfB family radical SAM enzyme
MDYSLFTSVVDDAVTLGAKTICLSGGEPFLHPGIIEMVSYIQKKNTDCYIYTSGIILDAHGNYAPVPADILLPLAGKASRLIFNIEAAREDTYDKIMGTTGCFNIMKQSVVTAKKYTLTTEAHFVPCG